MASSANSTTQASNANGGPSLGSSKRLTAQQQRLQQMISMQHTQRDSMTQDYMKQRSSSVGGGTGRAAAASSNSPAVSPKRPAAGAGSHGYGAVSSAASAGTATLPVPSPTHLQQMSFLGPAGATPTASNLSALPPPPPPGRTAEYAKLLPGSGVGTTAEKQGGAPPNRTAPPARTSDVGGERGGGGIHYQSYSRQQPTPPPPSDVVLPSDLMGTADESRQRQDFQVQGGHGQHQHQQQQQQRMQPEYYDAASNLPGYPPGYQNVTDQTPHMPYLGAAGPGQLNITTQSSQSQSQSEHQFHYGDPNHAFDNNAYDREFPYHHGGRHPYDTDHSCIFSRCFRSCFSSLLTAENLHRSLCFGAIDGMLTGSGIAAACVGLGLLSPVSSDAHRWGVVALSLAACTSDGICMAIGHIWSTYVLQHASIAERKEERLHFAQDRASAKARLVDMLLGRGMLKIDAMSVADTLEGYPDIFVSALVGDTGHALGVEGGGSRLGSAENLHSAHGSGALGLAKSSSHGGGGGNNPDGDFGRGHYPPPLHHAPYGQGGGGGLGGRSSLHYGSYGQFDEIRDDPDQQVMHAAMKDGWSEGNVMFLSFSSFSVIPSLTYLLALDWFPVGAQSGATSTTTVAVSIISGIMLLLGIWKSYFFDSNWAIFGVETVLVLLLCIISAYCIGAGLNYGIGKHFEL